MDRQHILRKVKACLRVRHGFYTREMARRERELSPWSRFLAHTRVPDGGVIATKQLRAGILFRWGSFWVGAHWSPANRRLCINLVPCVTIWIIGAGGVAP